ncbi:hypothetical protein OC845_001549 [Tilletia horrida]|nr:hypothetical protein OC845_001549 [Tilletia horrida]
MALPSPPSLQLYISGYGGAISHFQFNPASDTNKIVQLGSLTIPGSSPSWLHYRYSDSDPSQLIKIYATDEQTPGQVFALDVSASSGNLTLSQTANTGDGPVAITTTNSNTCLATADYSAGTLTVHSLEADTGTFTSLDPVSTFQFNGTGPVASRQDHSYPHEAITDPSGQWLYLPDLGADKIHVFAAGSQPCADIKQTIDVDVPAGSGPRHLAFYTSPSNQTFAYLTSELANTVTAFLQDASTGDLQVIAPPHVVLPPGATYSGYSGSAPTVAEVAVTADGRFVLVSARGSPDGIDHVAVYSRDEDTGALQWVDWYSTEGQTPRHFSLSQDSASSYVVVANQNSGSAIIFSRDSESGALTKETLITGLDQPNFAKFV